MHCITLLKENIGQSFGNTVSSLAGNVRSLGEGLGFCQACVAGSPEGLSAFGKRAHVARKAKRKDFEGRDFLATVSGLAKCRYSKLKF